jgi:single-strand DNA-binding protein
MSSLRNRVNLIGNLGHDPEMKSLENGKKITKFTLATNEEFKNGDGQKVKETTWHNIVVFDKLAELAGKFLKKGGQVAVEGRIAYRTYEDKNGVTKYITEIIVHDLLFLQPHKEQVKVELLA